MDEQPVITVSLGSDVVFRNKNEYRSVGCAFASYKSVNYTSLGDGDNIKSSLEGLVEICPRIPEDTVVNVVRDGTQVFKNQYTLKDWLTKAHPWSKEQPEQLRKK